MYIILSILIGILALLLIWIVYEIIIAIYHKTLRYETFPSTAEVWRKDYEIAHTTTTMVIVGKTMAPRIQYHAEEYNVYLMYEGEEYCLDDEDLYNSVNEGNIISVVVHKGYNKHNEVKNVYLSLEE